MRKNKKLNAEVFQLKNNRYPIPVIMVVHEDSNYLWWILDHLVLSGITVIWNLEKSLRGAKREQFYKLITSEVKSLKSKFPDVTVLEVWPENKKRKFKIHKGKSVLMYVGNDKLVAAPMLDFLSNYVKYPEYSEIQGTFKTIESNSYIHQFANPKKHTHGFQVGVKDYDVLKMHKLTKQNLNELAFISAGFLKRLASHKTKDKSK